MEDTKLPAGPVNTRSNIILNTNSYQLTSHNSLLKQQTSYDTKEKGKESSEKKKEIKEDLKYPTLEQTEKDMLINLFLIMDIKIKKVLFPQVLNSWMTMHFLVLLLTFCFPKLNFLTRNLI